MIRLFINSNHDFLPPLLEGKIATKNFHKLLQWIGTRKLEMIERQFLYRVITFNLFNEEIDTVDRRNKRHFDAEAPGAQKCGVEDEKYFNRRAMLNHYILKYIDHFLPEHQRDLELYATKYEE